MDADFDTGPILAQGSRPVPSDTSIEGMRPTIVDLHRELLPLALDRVLAGDPGDEQTEGGATYAGTLDDGYLELV